MVLAKTRQGAPPDPRTRREIGRILEAYRPAIKRRGLLATGSAALAEELCQDVIETAWRKLPEFQGDSLFKTWIFGIARNVCRNARRKHRDFLTEDGVFELESPETSVLSSLRRHEREELIRAVTEAAMTTEEKRVIYLRYHAYLSIKDIDVEMALTGSGARGLLQRCKRRLAVEIRARLEEMGHGSSFLRTGG